MCHQGLSVALVSLSIADWCCQPTKWLAWTGSMKLLTWMHVEIVRIKLMHIVSQEKGWNICVFVKVCLIPDAHPACPFFLSIFFFFFFFFWGGGGRWWRVDGKIYVYWIYGIHSSIFMRKEFVHCFLWLASQCCNICICAIAMEHTLGCL